MKFILRKYFSSNGLVSFSIKLNDVPPFFLDDVRKYNGFVCLNEFAKHFLNKIKSFAS